MILPTEINLEVVKHIEFMRGEHIIGVEVCEFCG